MKALHVAILVSLCAGAASSAVTAADVPELLAAKRCIACHDTKATLIGPPYAAIAVRHRANKNDMIEVLARKILLGGGGNWGPVPMVPMKGRHGKRSRSLCVSQPSAIS